MIAIAAVGLVVLALSLWIIQPYRRIRRRYGWGHSRPAVMRLLGNGNGSYVRLWPNPGYQFGPRHWCLRGKH